MSRVDETLHREIDTLNHDAYLIRNSDPVQSRRLATRANELAESCGYAQGIADAIRTDASMLSDSNLLRSYELATQAVAMYQKLGDESGESSALVIITRYLNMRGEYRLSVDTLVEAYSKSVRSGNHYVAAICLFNFGANAEERCDFKTASDFYGKARDSALLGANDHIYWSSIPIQANSRFEMGERDQELAPIQVALDKLKATGALTHYADGLATLAKLYAHQGNRSSSVMAIREGQLQTRVSGSAYVSIYLRETRGRLAMERGDFTQAVRTFSAALQQSREHSYRGLESIALKALSNCHRELGDAPSALSYLREYVDLHQEIMNDESERVIRELHAVHQTNMIQLESEGLRDKNIELGAINQQLKRVLVEREELQKELERLLTHDDLTGALSRRKTLSLGAALISRRDTADETSYVLLMDIDHFKSINDTFGHGAGDEVLRKFVSTCTLGLRANDVMGRLGGEEFCALLMNTSFEEAEQIAIRLIELVRSIDFESIMGDRQLTVSIGMAEVCRSLSTIEAVLHSADVALYKAKRAGRDRLEIALPELDAA